jgi:hypothetical protein
MNKSLPLENNLDDLRPAQTVADKDPGPPATKRDLLSVMRRIDKALQGYSEADVAIVLAYLSRKR